ncbi:hypothetical protein CNYM01_08143 [Colletotrichum nymphaeae SA-01]|uniref:Uncharacterized protein n=1 Tax=Colletotrichum nymphaeae SA-01 TaxID=1460502 RepID=A0A135UHV9_9PEZI|nr:hypothetical protein CNYM01_08143 [Colletotrichum nymphaeae SA-01]
MDTSGEARREASSNSIKRESRLLQWPPQKLKNGLSKPSELLLGIFSLLMVVVIMTYIGILLLNDGRDIESLSTMWKFASEFSRLGPTAVPLMFAFVIGRAVRSYGHWRLQRGERIGTLDSLFGSTTLTGTITTIIDLKRIGGLGGLLVVIWSLSPLGGQAALRVLSPRTEEIPSRAVLLYLNNSVGFPQRYMAAGMLGQQIPVNTLVLGSLGATDEIKNSRTDTWGNIKIPMIESFPQHLWLNNHDWISLDQYQDEVTYSALVGIPVANVSQRHRSSLTLETSYLKLDCTDLRNFTGNATEAVNPIREGCDKREGISESRCNYKFKWGDIATVPYPYGRQNSTRRDDRCTDPRVAARDLLYWNYDVDQPGIGYTMAKCSMTTSFVEVHVFCLGWDCKATAVRQSASAPQGGQATNRTFFDGCPQENSNIWRWFFRYFDTMADSGGGGIGSPTIVQSYLVDPKLGLNASAAWNLPSVYKVGKELFSVHLGQILNTYWWAMIGNEPLFLGHPENYDGLTKWATGSSEFPSNDDYVFSETEATVYVRVQVLRYNKPWMIVLAVATLVLLLTTVLDFALSLKIWVPKLLMNISTLTRGNPNYDVPAGGGALSDEARAKLLANVKVRFGDAEGVDESSDLVIGNCVEHGGRVSKLTKGKLYT